MIVSLKSSDETQTQKVEKNKLEEFDEEEIKYETTDSPKNVVYNITNNYNTTNNVYNQTEKPTFVYCKHCGAKNKDTQTNCSKCGAPL